MKLIEVGVFVVVPWLLIAPGRRAEACTPPQCYPGAIVPATGGHVPANTSTLVWVTVTGGAVENLKLSAASAPDTALPFTTSAVGNGTVDIHPDAPLTAGETYTLADSSICAGNTAGPVSTFTATAAAPPFDGLGTLSATAPTIGTLQVGTVSGSCSSPITAAHVDIDLALSAEAEPWKDLLEYQTYVDDQPWWTESRLAESQPPGSSWVGRGHDRIYATCASTDPGAANGVAEGTHVVRIDAVLPGSATLHSSTTVTVTLACEPDVGSGSGSDDGGDGGDANTDGGGEPENDDLGCAAGPGATPPLAAIGIALGALVLRRRRRAR